MSIILITIFLNHLTKREVAMTHPVNFSYKNYEILQKLTCDFLLHPYNKNLMFCQTCGVNEYDIRDIVEKTVTPKQKSTEDSFWLLMGVILV